MTPKAVYAAGAAGSSEMAIEGATQALAVDPSSSTMLEARAFVLRGERRYAEALADYLRMLEIDSKSSVGLTGVVSSLRALGAAQLAVHYAKKRPELFSSNDLLVMAQREAGLLTRLGGTDAHVGPQAFELTDQARGQFQTLADSAQLDSPVLVAGSAGFDYLVAEFNRRNFTNVCQAFERLESSGTAIPDYVVHVVAQSYSSLKNPVRALELLRRIAERNQDDTEFLQSYFYALVDNEHHVEATRLLDAAVARTPVFLDERNPRLRRANPAYVQLVTLAAWSRAFDDRLQTADDLFRTALAAAPANESLRDGLGTVQLWTGRPRAAEDAFRQAIALNSSSIEPRRGLVAASIARGDERAAREALEVLHDESPYDTQVLRLQRDQVLRNGPALSIRLGRSAAHIPAGSPAAEVSRRVKLTSALYHDTWRMFSTATDSSSAPDQVEIRQSERAIGVEHQVRDFSASFALSKKRNGRNGVQASGRWSPADGVTFSGELESATNEVPSRAYVQGIHGRRVSVSAEWQARVATSLAVSGSGLDFSDGNHLRGVTARWREVWHQSAPVQAWTAVALSRSTASRQDVPYFSPASSNAKTVTAGLSLLGSRQAWLGRSRWHHLEVDVGTVEQLGFSAEMTKSARYRLNWQWSPKVAAELAVERARRIYDGRPETQNAVRLHVNVAL